MRSFGLYLCVSALLSINFAVQHKSFGNDVFDMLSDMAEDSGLPTNLLEDFSMSNLAAKVPFLQYPQPAATQQYPSSSSGGPIQYIQNLAPLGLGQFFNGLLGSTATGPPSRPISSLQSPVYPTSGDTSLLSALTSIAKYDDLKCVPRLLCEVAAGGRPGEKQHSFSGRNTILSLLSVIGGDMASPVVVFGRAMLLGLTAQGDPGTCFSAYPTCPRDADRLLDYLNNHRGGFFRFFSANGNPAYYTQHYHQARIQTAAKPFPHYQVSTNLTPPRVTSNPDNGHRHLIPQRKIVTHKRLPPYGNRPSSDFQKPLTFPGDRTHFYKDKLREENFERLPEETHKRELYFFPDHARNEDSRQESSTESYRPPFNPNIHRLPPPVAVQLPDRTGTGELLLDNDGRTFSTSASPARRRRAKRATNASLFTNTWKKRMVFPLEPKDQSRSTRKMRFPIDVHEKPINSHLPATIDSYWKLTNLNSVKNSPLWDKPRDTAVVAKVSFPNFTNKRENDEQNKYFMKFPSENFDEILKSDASTISFSSESTRETARTPRMKFPSEHSDKSGELNRYDVKISDPDHLSGIKFQTDSKENSECTKVIFLSYIRNNFAITFPDSRDRNFSTVFRCKN